MVSYEKRGGIWYRIRQRKNEVGETRKQILVPKSLTEKVMEVARDSWFGEHLEMKKTEERIQTNFFWQGLHEDITIFADRVMFVRKLCRGSVPRAPLEDMLVIDQLLKRVAIDLVGPIPMDKGHRYILTFVDYATRYPKAVPLKNIDTETVAEALLDIYSRVGIPEEVLSDFGTQLTSECMKEIPFNALRCQLGVH